MDNTYAYLIISMMFLGCSFLTSGFLDKFLLIFISAMWLLGYYIVSLAEIKHKKLMFEIDLINKLSEKWKSKK
jgi:hypothetical protein